MSDSVLAQRYADDLLIVLDAEKALVEAVAEGKRGADLLPLVFCHQAAGEQYLATRQRMKHFTLTGLPGYLLSLPLAADKADDASGEDTTT